MELYATSFDKQSSERYDTLKREYVVNSQQHDNSNVPFPSILSFLKFISELLAFFLHMYPLSAQASPVIRGQPKPIFFSFGCY